MLKFLNINNLFYIFKTKNPIMKYIAHVTVMPQKEILDPQGKAVTQSLNNLNLTTIHNVRVGKSIVLEIDAANENEAETITDTACKKLLANLIMETYEFKISLA